MKPTKIEHWGLKGLLSSGLIFALWGSLLSYLLLSEFAIWKLGLIVFQTMLYTGLFITAHDAMHGTVIPSNRKLNDIIGWAAVLLYALFSFRKLRERHTLHHDHPGQEEDPDFHDGEHSGFWAWYWRFLTHYVTWKQILGMAIIFNVLEHLVGVSLVNLLVFWVLPSLLSTLQLFYFGTYLPHRGEHDNPHHARSNTYSEMVSFLTCYHFGYHLEHHEYPWAPWWYLPTVFKKERDLA